MMDSILQRTFKLFFNVLDLMESHFLGLQQTMPSSSNYSMTSCLEQLLENGGTVWSAGQNHLPCMTHVIQLALGAFMDSLGVKVCHKSWEDAEREKIGSQGSSRRNRHGGVRVEKVVSLKPGFQKIVEKVWKLALIIRKLGEIIILTRCD